MAVGVLVEFDGTTDFYDEVDALLNLDDDPPQGMILHTAGATDTGLRVFDVWASAEDYQSFVKSRLGPAIGRAAGDEAPPVEPVIYELHNHVIA